MYPKNVFSQTYNNTFLGDSMLILLIDVILVDQQSSDLLLFYSSFVFFFGLQVLCQAQCMSVMDSALWCDNCVCVMGEVKYLP